MVPEQFNGASVNILNIPEQFNGASVNILNIPANVKNVYTGTIYLGTIYLGIPQMLSRPASRKLPSVQASAKLATTRQRLEHPRSSCHL